MADREYFSPGSEFAPAGRELSDPGRERACEGTEMIRSASEQLAPGSEIHHSTEQTAAKPGKAKKSARRINPLMLTAATVAAVAVVTGTDFMSAGNQVFYDYPDCEITAEQREYLDRVATAMAGAEYKTLAELYTDPLLEEIAVEKAAPYAMGLDLYYPEWYNESMYHLLDLEYDGQTLSDNHSAEDEKMRIDFRYTTAIEDWTSAADAVYEMATFYQNDDPLTAGADYVQRVFYAWEDESYPSGIRNWSFREHNYADQTGEDGTTLQVAQSGRQWQGDWSVVNYADGTNDYTVYTEWKSYAEGTYETHWEKKETYIDGETYLHNGTYTEMKRLDDGNWLSCTVEVKDGVTQLADGFTVSDNGEGYYWLEGTFPDGSIAHFVGGNATSQEDFLYHTFSMFGWTHHLSTTE